ncbi:hypothetical protein [Sphingobacterium sp. UGAL515B_05]|uniref:hypothetical protein n=1 Tax=Sphingobacterium sp. UGAL515B_05 TaxID=2986767 RepID=UPI0029550BBE|nr:hypothetical protein [Sphingobacterium sp. UGAL515B_05]WON93771.1 hypothetical protein OK025_21295 [Sphingobacterium sp. UGAL515B_05]
MSKFYSFISFLFLLVIVIFIASCKSGYTQNLNEKYLITEHKLDSILTNNDTNIVIMYTSWCSGSKETIDNFYDEVLDSIKSQGLGKRIILLMADEKVDTNLIIKQRSRGYLSYCLEGSGTSAIENRSAIKGFIGKIFPNQEISWLGIGFKIPVELLISKDRKILNSADELLPFKYCSERFLGIKIGQIRAN